MTTVEYNRQASIKYAERWAKGRNPAYYDFSNLGGDCTNFVSQCIYASCGIMNYTLTFGWYYVSLSNRSPSWSGVPFLYDFLTTNRGDGPFGEEVPIGNADIGDIIQLRFDGKEQFSHSMIVTKKQKEGNYDNIYIATHTDDEYDRLLSTYNFKEIRCIKIIGIKI